MKDEMQYTTSDQVSAVQLEDGAVLLDLRTGRHFSVNPVGATLWQRLDQGPATRTELSAALREVFDVEETRLSSDLDHWLDLLRRADLIH